jgi:Ca-activated chloride channel family protein
VRFAAESWLLLLAGLPFLLGLLRWSDRRARQRLGSLLGEQATGHIERDNPRIRQWRRFLLLSGLFWLILALARPQWGAHEVTVKEKGTDIVIALDISNSMLAEDVAPNRLERAKTELADFLNRLPRGRVGLVLFAGAAFVQCPLTMDYGTAQIFLRMAEPDMISEQGTAIASALATARELLASGGGRLGDAFEAIVLVTDGEDLEGDWEQEVQACHDNGVVILPVGVGHETGGLIPVTDDQGRAAGFMKDDTGNVVMTRLDLASLERMAATTGGTLFRIGADGLAGQRLRDVLSRLGERELEERRISAYEERFYWPLGMAVLSFWLRQLVRPRRRRVRAVGQLGPASGSLAALIILAAAVTATPLQAAAPWRPAGAAEAETGRDHFSGERYEEALQAFETARALNPDDPRLSLAVGETLFKLERFDEALREFQRALILSDSPELRAESLYNAGTSWLVQGDPARSAELLIESLKLAPDQLDAMHNLEIAMDMLQQGQQSPDGESSQDEQSSQSQDQQSGDPSADQQREQSEEQAQQQEPPQPDRSADQSETSQDNSQSTPEPENSSTEESPQDSQPDPQDAPESQEPDQDRAAESDPQPAPADPADSEQDPDKMTQAEAMQLLRALDHDEEELKRSVQKRLQGGKAESGKRW